MASSGADSEYLPTIDLRLWAPEELKFQASPDLVVLAEDCLGQHAEEAFKLIKTHSSSTFFAYHATEPGYAYLEYLARLGVKEVLGPSFGADQFCRKVILLSAKRMSSRSGALLLVEGAKGGAGVTSTVASFASAASQSGLKVVVVDLDFGSQDLSRFIYSRPFVNEHVAQMLRLNKPVLLESVLAAISPAWEDIKSYSCLSPIDASLFCQIAPETLAEIYFRIIQVLDEEFDLIIVDAGSASGNFLRMFRRLADKILILFSMEAADLYSSVQLLRDLSYDPQVNNSIQCVFVGRDHKARQRLAGLVGEVSRASGSPSSVWLDEFIPKIENVSDWPLTGKTIFQRVGLAQRRIYLRILSQLNLGSDPQNSSSFSRNNCASLFEIGLLTRKLLSLDFVRKNFQLSKVNPNAEVAMSPTD